MEKKLVLLVRKVLIVLLILWMICVFLLSQQNGEQSGGLSKKVAMFICFGNIESAENIEPMIRKVAHMTEFGIGAMIFYGLLSTYRQIPLKIKIGATIAFIVVCSGLDEFHQSFIDSRNASYVDVAIDIFGGALGTGACYLLGNIISLIDTKVQEEVQKTNG